MPVPKEQTPRGTVKVPQRSILDDIAPLSEPVGGLTVALYGKSGTGKTTVASTFKKPLLLVGTEDGTKSIYTTPGIEYKKITDCDDCTVICEAQANGTFPARLTDRIKQPRFRTVVLDSATFLQGLVVKKVLGLAEVPQQLSWGTATLEEWGVVSSGLRKFLYDFLCLANPECDVVIVAQEREFDPTTDSGQIVAPYVSAGLMPSVAGWLAPSVDYLIQTFIRMRKVEIKTKVGGIDKIDFHEVPEFCLRTGPHAVYNTKFRKPKEFKVPELIVDPDYEKIMKVIRGKPLSTPPGAKPPTPKPK